MCEKPRGGKIPEDRSDLFEHYQITVDKGQSLLRIDKFLMDRLENVSRNKLQEAVKKGYVFVNQSSVKTSYKVKPGDNIQVMLETPKREIEVIPQDIPLKIAYEDNDVIMVNKPAGMVVHPAYGNYQDTLLNAMKYYLEKNHPGAEPYMVHRIDKDTTGLLLIAKNEQAQNLLAQQFFSHSIDRQYTALVWGDVEQDEGTVEGNLGRSPADRKIMTVYPNNDKGKHAVTHYRVIERFGYVTALDCHLETGRTHQIRAHMKHLGHPLFNDQTYGGDRIRKGTSFSKYKQFIQNAFNVCPRQALHARMLGFQHPKTGKRIIIEAPMPQDMELLMDKWRKYARASIQSKQNPKTF